MAAGRVTFLDQEWGLHVVARTTNLDALSLLKPMAHHLGAVTLDFEVGR
jgi:hypothetical protein